MISKGIVHSALGLLHRRSKAIAHRVKPERPIVWPTIEDEVGDWSKYLKGKCLNAGAGNRDISHIIDGQVINQDIPEGLHNNRIDIYSPIDRIPLCDSYFDSIFCNAVLEHVPNPDQILDEFHRVIKDDGYLYLAVPFLQPHHADPKDFQRYTKDGLCEIVERHGFRVVEVESMHTVYHTLAWITERWLISENSLTYIILRCILFPILRNRCIHSSKRCDSIASAFKLIATKYAMQAQPQQES
ncbi:MAG: SAM-dependent methyltransferase [Desulfobacteraceae bacterium]|nr:MAG: SAM-dependent methyltransferase [Desulfobacteraceae bacterium]